MRSQKLATLARDPLIELAAQPPWYCNGCQVAVDEIAWTTLVADAPTQAACPDCGRELVPNYAAVRPAMRIAAEVMAGGVTEWQASVKARLTELERRLGDLDLDDRAEGEAECMDCGDPVEPDKTRCPSCVALRTASLEAAL